MPVDPPWLRPDWDAPVGALVSIRAGGISAAPWDSLNLGVAVGDDVAAVTENRRRFAAACGGQPVWLRQVHGSRVLRLAHGVDAAEAADAAWTDAPGWACAVQVADCLPVLLAHRGGRAVAAAHAGWRGLAAGVVENTVQALCDGIGCLPGDVVAWLGPCIGPRRFEVGDDVRTAFAGDERHFVERLRPDGSRRWLADLPGLARDRLHRAGVSAVGGADICTVEDRSRFFSFRRDGITGRFAAAVWLQPR